MSATVAVDNQSLDDIIDYLEHLEEIRASRFGIAEQQSKWICEIEAVVESGQHE